MNQINPEKLLLSKWTAVNPKNKQRHFIVNRIVKDTEENIIACELEAVINQKYVQIPWQNLKDSNLWLMGWQ